MKCSPSPLKVSFSPGIWLRSEPSRGNLELGFRGRLQPQSHMFFVRPCVGDTYNPCIQTQNFDQQKSLPCVGWMVWKLFRNHSCGRPVKLFYNTAHCTVTKPRNALFFFEWCTSKSQLTKNSFTLKDDDVLTRCYASGKLAHHRFLLLSFPQSSWGDWGVISSRLLQGKDSRFWRDQVFKGNSWPSCLLALDSRSGGEPDHIEGMSPRQKKNLEDRPHSEQIKRIKIL